MGSLKALHLLGWWALMLFVASMPAFGQAGSVRLTAYPEAAVADGRSIILLTAECYRRDGKPVPDGTTVFFNATLGQFREQIVKTEGGAARATLIAGSVPGVSKITATVEGGVGTGEIQVLFVGDQKELLNISEFVEVAGSEYLGYAVETNIMAASGVRGGASVRYRFCTIVADDLQVDCSTLVVVARNAIVSYGSTSFEYVQAQINIRSGEGAAMARREGELTAVQFKRGEEIPLDRPVSPSTFQFADLSASQLVIVASSAWFYPGERIQFRRANFYVEGERAFTLPLYSHAVFGSAASLSDNLFGIRDGKFYVDVPYYYTLTPETEGALKLRTQRRYGRGIGASSGLFMDLEHAYRGKNRSSGQFTTAGLLRSDWGANWRHYQPIGTDSQLYLYLDSPSHTGLFGSVNWNKQWTALSTGLSLSGGRQWSGSRSSSQRAEIYIATMPRPVADLPLRFSMSINAGTSVTQTTGAPRIRRDGIGVRSRLQSIPWRIGNGGSLSSALSFGRYFGNTGIQSWETLFTATYSGYLGGLGTIMLGYDFSQDPLSSTVLGKHRLTANLYSNYSGRIYVSGYLARGLDVPATTLIGDASYRLADLWRIGVGITWTEYSNSRFNDYYLTLGYRIGLRELALSWSRATQRLSIDILAASF